MANSAILAKRRAQIRANTLADETVLAKRLIEAADIGAAARDRARANAADFVRDARAQASRSSLIDKFLQEYGLSTAEGVTLMRLAEALLRTPDAATADALIRDKVDAGDWAAHKGKSPFPLVNFSTRALMLTAAWLDDVEAKDPLRRMVKSTKALLDRAGEPVIRASVAQAMKIMGDHFVLGETIGDAQKRAREFARTGYNFSFDMLGEAAHTHEDALKYFRDYENAISEIAKEAKSDVPADNPGISVKLSALHPRYEYGKKERVLSELGARAKSLALKAKAASIGFNIDAEEANRLDLSLDLIEALMRDPDLAGWDGFGVVVQAYQRRATFVLDWLADLARETGRRIMVRLVKGAYWDSEIKRAQVMGLQSYPVFTRKVLTDVSYQACARMLFANTDVFYPQFATHNALTATIVRELAGDYADYELQRLHGMGEALHDRLLESGARSRIYAPVGGHRELLPYLVRRLLENGANSSFVNQLIDPDLSVDDVVADPVEEARSLNTLPNPSIPAPRDLFAGARLAAEGWDETDPDTAAQLEIAVGGALSSRADYGPIINGASPKGAATPSTNPAHPHEIIGNVDVAEADLVAKACASATAFQDEWAATPAAIRGGALFKAAELLELRAEQFMHLATREAGKTIPDAIAEIREAVDFLRYYGNECEKLTGEPLGVIACISPWNFPLAIFIGQVAAALSAGNTVVAKPAEQTPIIAYEAVRLLHEAGIPVQALHFLPGGGPDVGAPLVKNPEVKGVVFTGSTEVAQVINRSLCEAGKPDATLIAETGGINVMIVDSTALLEQAVLDVVASAFQSAGQRCSACRIVCVQQDVADRFNEMLAGAMAELSIGEPARLSTDVGPVIDLEAQSVIDAHIADMERIATQIARAPAIAGDVSGTFVRPTAFEVKKLSDVKREIFGPVLHILRFDAADLAGLVDDVNALGFGLTMGVHTRIDETMHDIVNRARVGNIYVNRNQIGAVVGVQPFGGEGLSGTGPKAGGPHYLEAMQRKPRINGAGKISISSSSPLPLFDQQMRKVQSAFYDWSTLRDRRAVLVHAAAAAGDTVVADLLRLTASLLAEHFEGAHDLPGPTGESNTLRLKGKGVAACLGGGDENANRRQIAIALAAGNSVLCSDAYADKISTAIAAAGGPTNTAIGFDFSSTVHEAILLDPRIRLVAFDGDEASRHDLSAVLARRMGPIIHLLSRLDAPWRFAAERILTINTTAAGGDVRLLSLSE